MSEAAIDFLYTLAWDLLDTAGSILDEEALKAPQRRAVDVGAKPLPPLALSEDDTAETQCMDQMNVVVNGPFPATPTQIVSILPTSAPGQQGFIWAADFRLTLWREHGVAFVEQPRPTLLDQAARAHLRDAWQLARGLAYRATHPHDYPIFPRINVEQCASMTLTFQGITPEGPSGGVRGMTLPIRLLLADHYTPPPTV